MATTKSHEKARAARAKKTLAKIEALGLETIRQVKKAENPAVELPIRALSNVSFSDKHHLIELGDKVQSREFFNVPWPFMQIPVAGPAKIC
jgi:DNA topoisomerase VI subunit A